MNTYSLTENDILGIIAMYENGKVLNERMKNALKEKALSQKFSEQDKHDNAVHLYNTYSKFCH